MTLTMPISQVTGVCKLGQGATACRYLAYNSGDDRVNYHCLKTQPAQKTLIDLEYRRFVDGCKDKKTDPAKHQVPQGDNCDGYSG